MAGADNESYVERRVVRRDAGKSSLAGSRDGYEVNTSVHSTTLGTGTSCSGSATVSLFALQAFFESGCLSHLPRHREVCHYLSISLCWDLRGIFGLYIIIHSRLGQTAVTRG
jgi:hypothetical protein